MAVLVSWAEFDAAAGDSGAGGASGEGMLVQVAWAEFDAQARTVSVQVGWAEFDAGAQPLPPPEGNQPIPPSVYSPGVPMSGYYRDSAKKYIIPLDVDPDDEDELIAVIMMELATYVL